MVKVKYIGDRESITFKMFQTFYEDWKKGEVRELTQIEAIKLTTDSPAFILVDNAKVSVEKKTTVEQHYMDLNRDGIVDKKDYSLAAKVLADSRKKHNN